MLQMLFYKYFLSNVVDFKDMYDKREAIDAIQNINANEIVEKQKRIMGRNYFTLKPTGYY